MSWVLFAAFGYFQLLAEYGISEIFGKLVKENMEVRYMYYGLFICTVIYLTLCYYIYNYVARYEWEHDQIRIEKERIENYRTKLNQLLLGYTVFVRAYAIGDQIAIKALQKLQRHVEALPQRVAREPEVAEAVLKMIEEISGKITSHADVKEVAATIEEKVKQLATLKRHLINS